MFIEDMHYDFKKKFNKIDSNQNRNLLVPEIDWALNEAQNIFLDLIAAPRKPSLHGFEKTQKNIDDIRPLVVPDQRLDVTKLTDSTYLMDIPGDYRYFVKGTASISKEKCKDKTARIYVQKHDDEFEESVFDSSSFEWREVNALFTEDGLRLFTDTTFTVDSVLLTYIKNPVYIHNAKDFRGGQYKLPSGQILQGKQDCQLSEQCCREIVDIAVAITAGEINASDYQIKLSKMQLGGLG